MFWVQVVAHGSISRLNVSSVGKKVSGNLHRSLFLTVVILCIDCCTAFNLYATLLFGRNSHSTAIHWCPIVDREIFYESLYYISFCFQNWKQLLVAELGNCWQFYLLVDNPPPPLTFSWPTTVTFVNKLNGTVSWRLYAEFKGWYEEVRG